MSVAALSVQDIVLGCGTNRTLGRVTFDFAPGQLHERRKAGLHRRVAFAVATAATATKITRNPSAHVGS